MKLVLGVGVPGCGKTTFLKPLAVQLNLAYISPDDIREQLTGDAGNQSKDVEVWVRVHCMASAALKDKGAVVDATFTRAKDRKKLIEIAVSTGAEDIVAYWFDVPLQLCVERNAQRTRIVPESVIRKMHARLALNPPTLSEGFTKIVKISA